MGVSTLTLEPKETSMSPSISVGHHLFLFYEG